ncbi:hypothetical protein C9374_000494 [Naegleria lovaniensis]|uniref:NADH dehydrogenase [ubiquinone] 1 alpha subcomplex assembly factor 3 n=1 Tax=Naegleria lovaniensis TaxID=51637 RepID=A0AA88KLW3_NAELO|nr:uncharacterized protein C9374_000494 [Naegleria lovaniensis]KAG2388330.1 hypothetical protein C9374_000494 [Naegleria lovaniensis]
MLAKLLTPSTAKQISLRFNSLIKNNNSVNVCNLGFVHQQIREFSSKLNYLRNKTSSNSRDDDNYHPTQPGQPQSAANLEQFNLIQYDPNVVFISGYGQRSFFLGNTRIFGSIFATTKQVFLWDVSNPHDITIESLALAEYLNPTPTLLLVGTGHTMVRLPQEVHEHFRSNGVVIEEMPSVNAVSTFNVLNQEGRDVCLACLSLEPVNVRELTPTKAPTLFIEIKDAISRLPPSIM